MSFFKKNWRALLGGLGGAAIAGMGGLALNRYMNNRAANKPLQMESMDDFFRNTGSTNSSTESSNGAGVGFPRANTGFSNIDAFYNNGRDRGG